jgi:hypothetical protein
LAERGANLDIDSEAAPAPDRISAEAFHLGARFLAVE